MKISGPQALKGAHLKRETMDTLLSGIMNNIFCCADAILAVLYHIHRYTIQLLGTWKVFYT